MPIAPWSETAPQLVDVAMGRAPADMLIRNGRWVNVHSGEIIPGTDVAIKAGRFAAIGARPRATPSAPKTTVIDAAGRYLVPGLCDGHMHVESGMVTVTEFCRAVIPHGTTSMFIDPHEIANVLGLPRRAADARRGGGDADQRLRADAQLRARGARPRERRRLDRRERCRRGHGLAQHHRPRRDDELSRRRRQRSEDAGRDRRDAAREQDRRRPLCLARPRPAVLRLCRRRSGRRPRRHARSRTPIARVRLGMRAMLRFGSAWYDVAPQVKAITELGLGRLLRAVPDDQVPDHSYVNPLPFTVDYDYSYDGIMRSFEFSYARLGLNQIDILYVHDIGAHTHGNEKNALYLRQLLDSGMKALDELKSTGAISAYGLGVNEVEVCLDVIARSPIDCILLAGRYSLLDRSAERGLLEVCREQQISLVIGGVFNSGILATGPVPGANFDYGPASDDILERVRAMQKIAQANSMPLAAAAMQFPLREPVVANVLIGTAKPSSLTRNMELLNVNVPEAAYAAFEPFTIR